MPKIKLYTGNNVDEYKSLTVDNFADFVEKANKKLGFTAHKFITRSNDDGGEVDDEETFADLLQEYPNLEIAAFKKDEKFLKRGAIGNDETLMSGTVVFGGTLLNPSLTTEKPAPEKATVSKDDDQRLLELQRREKEFEQRMRDLEIREREQMMAAREKEREIAKKAKQLEDSEKKRAEKEEELRKLAETTKLSKESETDLDLEIAKLKKHKLRISRLFDELKLAEKVDVCFLVDCTGSMGRYINETKDVIHKMVAKLNAFFQNFAMRFAFVGYRDHSDRERFVVLPFTSDKERFRSFVQEVKAYGGGDSCEDVFGGLKKVCELEWSHMSRIVFHIADAPCHGARYHAEETDDEFPNGHPDDPKIDDLFKTFGAKELNYYFAKINESTAKMLEEFDKVLAANNATCVRVVALGKAEDIEETVAASVVETVNGTKSKSVNDLHGKNKKALVKAPLSWNAAEFTRFTAKLHRSSYRGTIDDLRKQTLTWSEEEVVVYKAKNPFDEGSVRYAFAAYLDVDPSKNRPIESLPKHVLKTTKLSGAEYNTLKSNQEAIESQVLTRFLANEFNKVSPSQKKVTCSEVGVVQLDDDGSIYSVEPFFDGKFTKWTNNAAYTNTIQPSATLTAFSHWTYTATNKYLMVCDLQGVASDNQYTLTDPAITCAVDFERFTLTNMGLKGIKTFFKSHKCNHICEKMKLEKQPEQTNEPYEKPAKATELREDL